MPKDFKPWITGNKDTFSKVVRLNSSTNPAKPKKQKRGKHKKAKPIYQKKPESKPVVQWPYYAQSLEHVIWWDFGKSPEWRTLRQFALALHGTSCQCCGKHPRKRHLHVDHIKPKSKWRKLALSLSNVQILCSLCHADKAMSHKDYRPKNLIEEAKRLESSEPLENKMSAALRGYGQKRHERRTDYPVYRNRNKELDSEFAAIFRED